MAELPSAVARAVARGLPIALAAACVAAAYASAAHAAEARGAPATEAPAAGAPGSVAGPRDPAPPPARGG